MGVEPPPLVLATLRPPGVDGGRHLDDGGSATKKCILLSFHPVPIGLTFSQLLTLDYLLMDRETSTVNSNLIYCQELVIATSYYNMNLDTVNLKKDI